MRRSRAFLLILVLFLLIILVTMGFGLLGSRVGQYQSTAQAELAVRATALARAGLEDARSKLNRDVSFPPLSANSRPNVPVPELSYQPNLFRYSEPFYDVTNTTYLGRYEVTLDGSNKDADLSATGDQFLSITSTGMAGPLAGPPLATHSFRAYLDLNPTSPVYFQIIRFDDLGAATWGPP